MLARNLIANAAAAAAIAWLLASNPGWAQDAGWTVSEVTGGASVEVAGGPAVQAQTDLAVPLGAVIATEDDGRLSLTDGASVVTLSPGTEIEIREPPAPGKTSIFQRIGILMLEVERRARQHFEVETPYLAAVVKGTRFSVSVADAGAAVHVTDGMVEVSAPAAGRPVLVHPGQTATIDAHALDRLRLDGGRSESMLPEQGLRATHQQDDGDAGTKQVIRRSIGDASIDVSAATNGLVTSKTLTAATTAATDDVGGGTENDRSLAGPLDALTGRGAEISSAGALGHAAGRLGNGLGTGNGLADGLGSGLGGGAGNCSGLGNAIGNSAKGAANAAANIVGGPGEGLGDPDLGL
jgi:hypothetical protein